MLDRKTLLAGALGAHLVVPGALAQTPALVLRGATLIDGSDRAPLPDATVAIKNGWIVAVGSRGTVAIPKGARIVDLGGKYLLPGFVEMHGHVAIAAWQIDSSGGKKVLRFPYDDVAARELVRSQLAFGITTVRNPAGPTKESVALRDRVRMGELVGPRIITAGAPLDRPSINTAMDPVTTEAEVRAAVARQAEAGVDFVKLYASLDSAQVAAAVDEAHKHGIAAVGHLWRTSWTDAAEAGIDGITHIIVSNPKLLPPARRDEFIKSIRGGQFMFDWFKYADFDGPEITAMIAALVAHRITIDPTLVAFETSAWSDDSTFYPAESRRYVPPTLAVALARSPSLGWTAADFASAKEEFPRMQELTQRLFKSGVVLTVGTDAANPWVFHRELELLAGAGIPPADVIRMATRNAAISLRRTSEFGTVEPGKRADLVVLDADPLADIMNTRRISWVVQDGRIARPETYLPDRLRVKR
jgi:imidazolonepropionase-like amidohydrolase